VFGPPASGKTTVALRIVERLKVRRQRVVMNWQVFDRLPDWRDLDTDGVLTVEDLMAYRFDATDHGSDDTPPEPSNLVCVIATNACTRQLRLQYAMTSNNGAPAEWVGWWLYTPVATCQRWNRTEKWNRHSNHAWPQEVVSELAELLTDSQAPPSIEEGFSSLVHLDPSEFSNDRRYGTLSDVIGAILDDLDASCAEVVAMREGLSLHAYSCPGDFERLMHGLVRAIWNREHRIAYQWLEPSDDSGFALSDDRDYCRLQGLWPPHQGGAQEAATPITVPPPRTSTELHRGGWHRFSDAQAFVAVMEELRQFLHGSTAGQPPSAGLQGLIDRYGLQPVAG
jgi:hypothetical protein